MELYSYPTLNISNCVTVKLTERNYILWKSQFESFLSGQGLLGFVTGTATAPASTITIRNNEEQNVIAPNPDYEAWRRSDQVVMAWLLGSLSEDILSVVVGSTTSHDVWTNLAGHYNRTSSSRVLQLQRRLHGISKEGKTMDEYLRDLKNVFTIHGLTREYEPLITSLESSLDVVPEPPYEDILHRLRGYDDRLQSYVTPSEVSPHLAFYTTNRGRGQSRGRGGRNRGRGSFSTRGRGFHQQFSSGSSGSSVAEKPTCQICGKKGHQALDCWHKYDDNYEQQGAVASALAALHITDVTDETGWHPDTGETAHITNSTQRLQQAQPYYGSDTVMASDGNFLPITHIGSSKLPSTSGNLPLKDVLVCPDIAKSLLSVSKLTKDYPCSFTFDDDGVVVKDKATQKILTMG
ncbi:PREDICTED: uncharacterized protein LOC109124940 [Camelina sativa]|uniref:Uncharacterized protein LOC104774220 n=1 Tax=Camelina sativa TaxID=90675 RepID=A0ABM1QLF8_CAMSA|nr:PREDICTED: uncharacterized protein LOC104774220 [Camelina sativa]XP_019087596.1 PREDICTED: uncharacterized protein LOC109124940 [Camelina sativa]